MSNQHLYEKHSNGDRRTVVKKYSKGHELRLTESTIILKTDVALKVTEEYNVVSRRWNEVSYDLSTMVEIPDGEAYRDSRPPPTEMPGGGELPRAEVRVPWWKRWFARQDFPFGEGE